MTETMPKRINVMKVVTYDVEAIRRDMHNDLGIDLDTVDDVMEFIEEWVAEDFGSLSGLSFQDENGNEL
ncbi:MAG: hypothetical protein EB168_07305 [Euryarchaeota archaeon]|nr:hypothetical protein [Euryarchaeota archaeon]